MPEEVYQSASWPGVDAIESCSGSIGHGASPSVFTLVTYPQDHSPAESGDLVLSDGVGPPVVLKDCKVDDVRGRIGPDGQTWTLRILDRRWKWRGGRISGRYNQLDPRGKLVPWSIRSPEELAKLCLFAAKETRFLLDLPDGLEKATGADHDKYLRLGENFAESLANPPVVWDQTPPMLALARLAELFGRRLIYQPIADRILIAPLGKGADLPEGPCEVIAPSVDSPETPEYVAVAGAPVRIQCRLLLEPVGQEWDGEWLPIDLLSYTPFLDGGQVQVSTVTYTGSGDPTALYVTIRVNTDTADERDVEFRATPATVAAKLTSLRDDINAHPEVAKLVTATASATVLTLTGKQKESVWIETDSLGLPAGETWRGNCTQFAIPVAGKSWRASRPPNFGGVIETDRLSKTEAVDLARRWVYRAYRILAVDPHTKKAPLRLPWYKHPIERRQQLILQPTKVDQLRPLPRDRDGRDRGVVPLDPRRNPGFAAALGGILPDFYNGYSRDQPATVRGSISKHIGSVLWDVDGEANTDPTKKVYVPFTIDPTEQLVIFSEPVYREWPVAGTMFQIKKPILTLETAVVVTDDETGEVVRWDKEILDLGGSGTPEWQIREDVYVGIIGEYDDANRLKAFTQEGIEDARGRGQHYLDGMAARYRLTEGRMQQYIGIIAHDPDGLTQMVSWSIGPGGATTVVSANTEHDPWTPSYPDRRLKENLPPDKAAAAANILEQWFMGKILPPIVGNPGT